MTDIEEAAKYFKHHNNGLSKHVRVIGNKFFVNGSSSSLPYEIAEAVAKEYLWKILQDECEIAMRLFSPNPYRNYSVQFNATFNDGKNELSLFLNAVKKLDKEKKKI